MVLVDHRGFGGSDVGFPHYSAEDTGRDVVELIDAQGLRDVVPTGCSMGGAAAVWVAAERPAAVAGIVLLDPFVRDIPAPRGVPTLLSMMLNRWTGAWFWTTYYKSLFKLGGAGTADVTTHVARLHAHLRQPGRIETLRGQLFASKASCTARIPELSARKLPALSVWGSLDPDFKSPEEEARLVTSLLNGQQAAPSAAVVVSAGTATGAVDESPQAAQHARYVMIPGAGHYPHMEAADAVASAVLDFCNQFA